MTGWMRRETRRRLKPPSSVARTDAVRFFAAILFYFSSGYAERGNVKKMNFVLSSNCLFGLIRGLGVT